MLSRESAHVDDTERRTTILNLSGDDFDEDANSDVGGFAKILSVISGTTMVPWHAPMRQALRNPAGYDSCRVIALAGGSPQVLDPLQRRALLDFVRAGGTLLVCNPQPEASWLDRYLPVRLIGSRITSHIGAIALKKSLEICEADPAGGKAVLSDGSYVCAAYAPLGMGRISFISFPVTSLVMDQDALRGLWGDLLGLSAADPSWSGSALPARQSAIIARMIGTPVPSRGIAFVLAIGFAVFVVMTQLIWRAANRPFSYIISSSAAIVGTLVFLIFGFVHQHSASLTAAAVDVAHLTQSGGFMQEFAAFTGKASELELTTTTWQSTLRPSAYDDSHPPILQLAPFSIPDAGAAPRRVDRIWEASSPIGPDTSASALATFDGTGLRLSVNNQIKSSLLNPMLIYGTSIYHLNDIPVGDSQTVVSASPKRFQMVDLRSSDPTPANDLLEFMDAGPIINQSDIIRAQILASLLTIPQTSDEPPEISSRAWIAGWMQSSRSLITSSVQPALQHSEQLAIFPFAIHSSPRNLPIQVDSGFNEILVKAGSIPIYDAWKCAWVGCSQTGVWQIGIRPPREVGAVTWTRATLHTSVELPIQTMTIRHQQVRDGKVEINLAGAQIANWSSTFGSQPAASFDLSSDDIDRNGILWLLVKVEAPSAGGSVHTWQFTDFGVDLFGHTIGTPL